MLDVVDSIELRIHGRSMRPWIPPGSVVEVRRIRADEPLLHRVVIATDQDRRLAHRVVRVSVEGGEERFVLRGDNSWGSEVVKRADVFGVVVAIRVGQVRMPLERLPAVIEGGLAWIGRQLWVRPQRILWRVSPVLASAMMQTRAAG